MKTLLQTLVVVAFGVSQTACSILASRTEQLSVASDPAGARVTMNGMYIGVTPLVYNVRRNDPVSVLVSKDGYEGVTRYVDTGLSGVGIVDTIGGVVFLLPFFGLMAPGAWNLDTPHISVTLPPAKR